MAYASEYENFERMFRNSSNTNNFRTNNNNINRKKFPKYNQVTRGVSIKNTIIPF